MTTTTTGTGEVYTLRQSDSYKPTPRQKDYAGSLARDLRDLLAARGQVAPSASSLAKYYPIDRLKDALAVLKEGGTVVVD